MEVSFYHLTRADIKKTLPKLLEKIVAQGNRAVVLLSSEEQVQLWNTELWTYHPQSFLAHGTQAEGFPASQPVWLTSRLENPNSSRTLVLLDMESTEREGPSRFLSHAFEKVIYLIEAAEGQESSLAARVRQLYPETPLVYWKQGPTGWERSGGEA